MHVELKRVKILNSQSRETVCFTADLYIDGVKAGTARNDGGGGSNDTDFDDRELEEQFYAYCKSLPPNRSGSFELPMNGDFYISILVDKYQQLQNLKRLCRRVTLFRLKSVEYKPNEYREIAEKFTPQIAAYLRRKYGDDLAEIINERFAKPEKVTA